jgi:hypothetical protein
MTKFLAPRSMPARVVMRLSRRINVVMAGSEVRLRPCSLSIMFPAKLRLRRLYNELKTEGTSMNKFPERSSEVRLAASGCQAAGVKVCSEQSDRQRYLRHCHFSSDNEVDDDNEEFETTLFDRYRAARGREEELLRELDGRGDEAR